MSETTSENKKRKEFSSLNEPSSSSSSFVINQKKWCCTNPLFSQCDTLENINKTKKTKEEYILPTDPKCFDNKERCVQSCNLPNEIFNPLTRYLNDQDLTEYNSMLKYVDLYNVRKPTSFQGRAELTRYGLEQQLTRNVNNNLILSIKKGYETGQMSKETILDVYRLLFNVKNKIGLQTGRTILEIIAVSIWLLLPKVNNSTFEFRKQIHDLGFKLFNQIDKYMKTGFTSITSNTIFDIHDVYKLNLQAWVSWLSRQQDRSYFMDLKFFSDTPDLFRHVGIEMIKGNYTFTNKIQSNSELNIWSWIWRNKLHHTKFLFADIFLFMSDMLRVYLISVPNLEIIGALVRFILPILNEKLTKIPKISGNVESLKAFITLQKSTIDNLLLNIKQSNIALFDKIMNEENSQIYKLYKLWQQFEHKLIDILNQKTIATLPLLPADLAFPSPFLPTITTNVPNITANVQINPTTSAATTSATEYHQRLEEQGLLGGFAPSCKTKKLFVRL